MTQSGIHSSIDWRSAYERGRSLFFNDHIDEAIAAFQEAIGFNPDVPETHHDLGAVYYHCGLYQDALESFLKALTLNSDMSQAWFNGANSLCYLERFEEAVQWFENCLRLAPGFAAAHYNLANTYKMLEEYQKAIKSYSAAIQLEPGMAEAYNNLGTIYLNQKLYDRALTCIQKAIELKSTYPQAQYNLGLIFEKQGKINQGLECLKQTLEREPEYGDAQALLVVLLQQACDWESLIPAQRKLIQNSTCELQSGRRPSESPFLSFTVSQDPRRNFQIAGAWARSICRQKETNSYRFRHGCTRKANKRLTIGYMSEQFRNAATAHLMAGLFSRHDRCKFRINAYSWGKDDGSYYRRKIEHDVDRFVDIASLSNADAARCVYNDKVDILVDLMGWMHGHRMGIVAQRPAPIQVNYLGYPGTTGAPFMDYIVADHVVIEPHEHGCYSEKIVYLPECYMVTDSDPPAEVTIACRGEFGLPERGVVFCCFSTDYKIEGRLFDVWMKILHATPCSVLWLLIATPEAKRNLRLAAASRQIDPQRLIFAEPLSKSRHLARLKLADLALDTLTVNGHTTASDVLWAGVPLITCKGNHFASRVAASILSAAGLPELVVHDVTEYEHLAVMLGNSPERLSELRMKLMRNRAVYPLFNVQRFARHLEKAYDGMWQRYVRNLPPMSFEVQRLE